MTRGQLIVAINENEDAWSCPEHTCDMPEKEGNTGECCLRCAEKQLKAYEDKIRAEVWADIEKIINNMTNPIDTMKIIIEQLKEQNNDN